MSKTEAFAADLAFASLAYKCSLKEQPDSMPCLNPNDRRYRVEACPRLGFRARIIGHTNDLKAAQERAADSALEFARPFAVTQWTGKVWSFEVRCKEDVQTVFYPPKD